MAFTGGALQPSDCATFRPSATREAILEVDVGRIERSETSPQAREMLIGFASLNPSYSVLSEWSFCAIGVNAWHRTCIALSCRR